MKETPILFTPANIRAILDSRKVQTRRVVKYEDTHGCFTGDCPHEKQTECDACLDAYAKSECPYGVVGDRLWVREMWRVGKPQDSRTPTEIWEHLKEIGKGITILYGAGGWRSTFPFERPEPKYADNEPMPDWAGIKRSAMFMPKWAARLWLEITDVRVQRVQDISEQDCYAEGVFKDRVITDVRCYGGPTIEEHADRFWPTAEDARDEGFEDAVSAYAALWDSINKKTHPFSENSWVWAISFKKVQA
jgi:hypothetical protein